MTRRALHLAVEAVRLWTRLYTWGLPQTAAATRRAEIESDLWEQLNDPDRRPGALEIVSRVLFGMPNDLRWRVEAMSPEHLRRSVTLTLGSVGVAAAVWVGLAARPPEPPQRPAAPDLQWRRTRPMPPPPPPPPPICNPPGVGRPRVEPCTPWP
jgi:hypothetical protein